jgi:tetrahydromethanopterin S-methyltransferase subunit A
MLKVKPPDGYPPEAGRYVRGNDYSPVAVCVILDTFDFAIPAELNQLVMAGVDSGAALSGMLQTENIGIEKMICNIVANPNIRYIVLCGRESTGHMPGETLLLLRRKGVDEYKRVIDSTALTPTLSNIPIELIERFNNQIVTIVNLLCQPGEKNIEATGLNPKVVATAVKSCYQEEATPFMDYKLIDIGAYPETAIFHQIAAKLEQTQQHIEPGKGKMSAGLMLHKLLPQTDCRECSKRNCLAFAIDLARGKLSLDDCPELKKSEYAENRRALAKLLE